MQNCPSNFHSFSFQSSNFQFCQFSSLTFNFCQWRILLNPSYGLPLMSLKRQHFSFFFFSKLKEKKKKMYKKKKKRKEKENICSEIKTEESLHTKIPNLENLDTIIEGLASLFVVPETNFPHEMLAMIASFIDKSCQFEALELLATLCFFMFCHDLLNSTKLLVSPGDPSSSQISSSAKYCGRFFG